MKQTIPLMNENWNPKDIVSQYPHKAPKDLTSGIDEHTSFSTPFTEVKHVTIRYQNISIHISSIATYYKILFDFIPNVANRSQ